VPARRDRLMDRIAPLLGIGVLIGLGVLASTARRAIPWRLVATGVLLQVWLALFLTRPDFVPAVLTAGAAACVLVLVASLVRPLPGLWVPAARALGLLGWIAAVVHLCPWPDYGWLRVLLLALLLPRGRIRAGLGLVGNLAVLGALRFGDLPSDFVFQAVDWIARKVMWVVGFAHEGAVAVFGKLPEAGGFVFAIEVGAIICLFGGLMSLLHHAGFLPWLVGLLARLLHRTLGVSGAEALATASNIFVGQTEAPLVIRPYLARLTESETMALMTGGFATIAGSVLGAYVAILTKANLLRGPADLIAASVMSAPAALVFAKLFVPETGAPLTRDTTQFETEPVGTNALDALAGGVTAGLRLAVNVVAMLLVFNALILMLNAGVDAATSFLFDRSDLDFQRLYAYLFAPFAWLMGVEPADCLAVGELLGTKTIFNEFIAYERLADGIAKGTLSTRSAVLATYALCGFANFMSIGIQIGGLSQLAPAQRPVYSRLALRAMVAGALACQMTACIIAVIGTFG